MPREIPEAWYTNREESRHMTNSATIKEVQNLKPIIREELAKRSQGHSLAIIDRYDEQMLSDALHYLHGVSNSTSRHYERLGTSVLPDNRETAQLRVICEVVSDLSKHVDRTLLASMVVAIDLLQSRRHVKRNFAQHADLIVATS